MGISFQPLHIYRNHDASRVRHEEQNEINSQPSGACFTRNPASMDSGGQWACHYPSVILWSFRCGVLHLQSEIAFTSYVEKLYNFEINIHGSGAFFNYHATTRDIFSIE